MKKIIIILAALVCFSSCAHIVRLDDYMIVEKERISVYDGLCIYTIRTKFHKGGYKLGKSIITAPKNTYKVGDTVYFTVGNFNNKNISNYDRNE